MNRSLSQSQLASALKLTRNQINSYENAISQPSIEALQKIACYFEVKIDILVNTPINKSFFEKR